RAGLPDGAAMIANLYAYSNPPNYQEAAKWLRSAADRGSVDGAVSLAWLYETGNGVTKDYLEAARLYQFSANKGSTNAMYAIGMMYENAEGLPQNHTTAAKW